VITSAIHVAAKHKTTYLYEYHINVIGIHKNMEEESSAEGGFSRNNKAECIK